jgi:cytochrome d ubiquinol oxidase subunit I
MVGMGVLMLVLSWLGVWFLRKPRVPPAWLLRLFSAMTFSGWIATLAGWITTEVGRQPYLVYGVITTEEAASSVPASHIGLTLVVYALVYGLLLVSYLIVLTQLARKEDGGESDAEAEAIGPDPRAAPV